MYTIEEGVTDEELGGIDIVMTLMTSWHTMREYERVLRKISKWSDDEPSIWARQVLNDYERKLDS